MAEMDFPQGTIRYRDEGSGPAIVFVHGALVNGRLWEPVVERLRSTARCVVPDLPLGAHRIPMRTGLDPVGLAELIADLIEKLDLRDVTLVGNDTGGALCQLLVTRRPERIGRLVLTNCDAFDNFPPLAFRGLVVAARLRLLTAMLQSLRIRPLRKTPLAFGWLSKRELPDELLASWVEPFLGDAGVRRDTRRLLASVRRSQLLDNTARLHEFERPVLLVWAPEDRFFPLDHARRLAAIFPDARLVEVPDSYAFVSLDQPKQVADLIREFSA